MTPVRLLLYVNKLCEDPLQTATTIKARLALVKTSALNAPDSPDRGWDIAYYCDIITARIVQMETAVPPWSSDEIKAQVAGSITGLIPA